MDHYKEKTEKEAIVKPDAPEEVVIFMSQHIGAPAQPVVAAGDKVKVGQIIGQADAFVTALVHASVSGEVSEVGKMTNAVGSEVEYVKIKNDKQGTVSEKIKSYRDIQKLSAEDIRNIAKDAGLVGMGGAAFPTHVKLSPPPDKKIDTVILNAAECEPYLTADHRLLLEETENVLYGLRAIAKAADVNEIYIGIEDNKMDAVEALKKAGAEDFCKIAVLKTEYPTGAEKVLVKKILKRKVPNKGIPLDVGVIVSNVGTAYQLASTIKTGIPMIERVVTVSGDFMNPGNYLAPIGMLYSDLAKMAEEESEEGEEEKEHDEETKKIIAGGPMMGFAIPDLNSPVTKGSSGILLTSAEIREETNCIRCGKCIDVCPLDLLSYKQETDECMECGLCAYECPANISLVQGIKLYKNTIAQKIK